jgi:hypothetical protein
METLSSAVAAAKIKFATKTGTQVRTLPKRTNGNKLALDDSGQRMRPDQVANKFPSLITNQDVGDLYTV